MNDKQLDKAESQIEPYGYTLTSSGQLVSPGKKTLGVTLTCDGGRYTAWGNKGALRLWSGPDVGHFLARFYLAQRIR